LATAGIFELLARLQQRLPADDAEAAHLLHLAGGIGDDPVPRNQLRSHGSDVLDGNCVGKDVAVVGGIRLLGDIFRDRADCDLVFLLSAMFAQCWDDQKWHCTPKCAC
jgi:hypothetical protein